ncbi:DUF6580 family putative transport protein [Leptospira ellisii]|uniref:DUF6580 family putative transport protein n=1 Tax=Leptospira ellisii TaxID=2023197 RepID=A0A2N0BCG9_9LEPT|nr:DUF6580 family putative transport protein [Leptospira ellisii]MDV6237647.1 DUF6580 family putative transport protein [Leptospira ellisii]PJZ94237.1 hypothetical protein CH379_03595 [Leptospira ellisii]
MRYFDRVVRYSKTITVPKDAVSVLGVILAGISRFLPHPPNFTLVGAVTVYSGSKIEGWKSFTIPFITIFATDLILSQIHGYGPLYPGFSLVYFSLLVNVVLGKTLLKGRVKISRLLPVTVLASTQFFLLSNFSVWAFSSFYPDTFEGLLTCYIAAIPYFGGTLLGDLIYTPILFGSLNRIEAKIKATAAIVDGQQKDVPFENSRTTASN